jgi:hypothetical protein
MIQINIFEAISWLLFLIAVTGALFNIKKKAICFVFWSVSNAGWAWYNLFVIGQPAQGLQMLVFLGISISGVWEWWGKDAVKKITITAGE